MKGMKIDDFLSKNEQKSQKNSDFSQKNAKNMQKLIKNQIFRAVLITSFLIIFGADVIRILIAFISLFIDSMRTMSNIVHNVH